MKKILSFFVPVWVFLKKIGNGIKSFAVSLYVVLGKIRRGEALEFHPLVGIWANRIFKVMFGLAVAVFALGIAFGISIYKYKTNDAATRTAASTIPYPAAIVQGRIVTMNDYYKNYQYINKFYSATQQSNVDYGAIREQIMNQLMDIALMKSQAKKFGVVVKESDINNAYSDVVVQNGGEEEVKKVLLDLYGLGISDFKKLIADQILEQKLQETVPVQVRAQHILIRINDGATEAQIAEAKTRIDQVKSEIVAGADFAAGAQKYSEDTGSASNGGDLDFFSRDQMDSTFEKVAFETPVGQVSDSFQTQFGWHILKVTEKKGIVDKSFATWIKDLEKESVLVKFY